MSYYSMYATLELYHRFYAPYKEKFNTPRVKIIELTLSTFPTVYKQPTFVFFYAPWCHHCKRFKPVYEEVAQSAPLRCAMIDCEEYPIMIDQYDLSRFPTMIAFKNGKKIEYNGQHQGDALLDWMNAL
jgi:thiol-disulfide isomerase/thioredoxin